MSGERSTPAVVLSITHDDARAQHTTSILQERIADTFQRSGADSEALNLAAALGRALAHDGATPTLAATVLDPLHGHQVTVLRAALLEAYCAARETNRATADARRWELPGCAVSLGEDRFAVCASPPHEEDAAGGWADRVAAGLVKRGAKEVVLSGSGAPRERLEEALDVVGIRFVDEASAQPKPKPWLRLPWSKGG